mgnify:CR=1 FL=1
MTTASPSLRENALLRIAGILTATLGIVGTLGFLTSFAFGEGVAPVVRYLNAITAAAELVIAGGLWRRRRAAWAFGLALEGTMLLVNLMALPQFLRLGAAGVSALVLVGGRAVVAAILAAAEGELKAS